MCTELSDYFRSAARRVSEDGGVMVVRERERGWTEVFVDVGKHRAATTRDFKAGF